MYIVTRSELAKLSYNFLLQVKFIVPICLVWEHELKVVEAHNADIVSNNRIL